MGREEILDPGDDHVPQTWQTLAHGLDAAKQRRQAHDHADFGVGELVLELRLHVQRARRDDDRASPQAAVVGQDHLRAVRHQQRYPLAFAYTQREECVGETVGQSVKLGVGRRAAEEADRRSTRVPPGGVGQGHVQRLVRYVYIRGYTGVVRAQPGSVWVVHVVRSRRGSTQLAAIEVTNRSRRCGDYL